MLGRIKRIIDITSDGSRHVCYVGVGGNARTVKRKGKVPLSRPGDGRKSEVGPLVFTKIRHVGGSPSTGQFSWRFFGGPVDLPPRLNLEFRCTKKCFDSVFLVRNNGII
jgi:hypothetical protein